MYTSNFIASLGTNPKLIFIYVIIRPTFLIYNIYFLIYQNIKCCINNLSKLKYNYVYFAISS